MQPEAPLVVAEAVGGKRLLTATNAAARAQGLRVGMTVASAQALDAGLIVVEADHQADAQLLDRFAAWAMRYTPLVAVDPPDGLWLDVAGCAHLFGGEGPLLHRLIARFEAMGFAARGAVADTPGTAHAVARFGGGGVVPESALLETIEDLPIAALRLPADIVDALAGLGFSRIGQILAAPRAPMVRRFGAVLTLRLDQMLGIAPEALHPVDPPQMPRCHRVLVEPIATPEQLTQVAYDLARDLCRRLEELGQGARRLDLIFHRVDGERLAIRIGTARPSRDDAHLVRLLVEHLGEIEPGLGIEAMELAAPSIQPLSPEQTAAIEENARKLDLPGLIDRLANRLGARRLWRPRPVESHIPERALGAAAPLAPPCRADWPADLPRPPRLIVSPEKIAALAELPDHPPATFTWRGRGYRVRSGDGPERIHAEWWLGDEPFGVRDYFQVEVEDGSRYWLFRAGDGEQPVTGSMDWFVHGAFA